MGLKLEAPWNSFQKKINALFLRDPDIEVGEIQDYAADGADYVLNIAVRNHEKYIALDRLLPKKQRFGNVTVCILLYDTENGNSDFDESIALYETLFKGNPIIKDIRTVVDPAGAPHGFIRFKPEVIQFFDDDISDYSGNWTGLAQDIAREVFSDEYRGVNFCTADLREIEAGEDDKGC